MRSVFIYIFAMLLIVSCNSKPLVMPKLLLDYADNNIIALDVARIEIINNYAPPFKAPNIEHHLHPSLSDEIRRWSAARLKAIGTKGRLELVINDAHVIETPFADEQSPYSERYDTLITAQARLYNGIDVLASATIQIRVDQSHSLPKGATLADREALLSHILHDSIHIFDHTMQQQIRQYFSAYIRPTSPSRLYQ